MTSSARRDKLLLLPHPRSSKITIDARVWAKIDLTCDCLEVEFHVEGTLDQLSIPEPSLHPEHRDGLWAHTCFELFLGEHKSSRYLEFNFSPDGHWACFQFQDYRHETDRPKAPDFGVRTQAEPGRFSLKASIPITFLGAYCSIGPASKMSLCAVLEDLEGQKSYWALRHDKRQPDFHDPTTFEPLLDAHHR